MPDTAPTIPPINLPQIAPENFFSRVFHTNCPKWMDGYPKRNLTSGVMLRHLAHVTIEDGSHLRLWECLHCGVKCYAGLDASRRVTVRPYVEEEPIQGPPEEIGTGLYRMADGEEVGGEPDDLSNY